MRHTEEQDSGVFLGDYVNHQGFAGNTGVCFRKNTPGLYDAQYAFIAPNVIVFHLDAPFEYEPNVGNQAALPEDDGPFRIGNRTECKMPGQGRQVVFQTAMKQSSL